MAFRSKVNCKQGGQPGHKKHNRVPFSTEYRARKYLNPQTKKIVIAPLPSEVVEGGLFGADIKALTAFLKGDGHMSITTIQSFFDEFMGIKISRGLLCKKINSVSVALGQAYHKLQASLPQEKIIGIDETGHKDNGKKHWT